MNTAALALVVAAGAVGAAGLGTVLVVTVVTAVDLRRIRRSSTNTFVAGRNVTRTQFGPHARWGWLDEAPKHDLPAQASTAEDVQAAEVESLFAPRFASWDVPDPQLADTYAADLGALAAGLTKAEKHAWSALVRDMDRRWIWWRTR